LDPEEIFMTFAMELRCPADMTKIESEVGPADDLVSLAMDGCSLLAEAECQFIVSGFGDDRWPVDVAYDLSVVMEQLPDVLAELRAGRATPLDFYGQGVERVIDMSPDGPTVTLACRSGTDWVPQPTSLQMPLADLEQTLVRLASSFAGALNIASPGLAASEPLPAWRRGEL
jgi:hypothetical protein